MQKISRMLLIPLLMFSLFASAQTRKISGKVVGNNNEPVAGASISVKGSSAGASANNEGNFVLEARGAVTLIVSGIGFNSIEVPVSADQLTVSIALTPAQGFTQSEIVVTSFGMTRSKRALGYSVTQVGGDRFTESRTANIGNALSGKVAGVNVSTPASGAGGSSRVLIRGGSSLLGNDQPLYVINGVPMESSNLGSAGMWGGNDAGDGLSAINPDDIESISVLKGNTAAALYGARAANGVIMITTKTGKARKGVGISVNSNVTWDQAIDYTDFQKQYGVGRDGQKPALASDAFDIGQGAWGQKFDGSSVINFDGKSRPYSHNGVNLNSFYRTGMSVNNSVAFSGGNQNGNYRFGVSDLSNKDIMPNASFNRQNFNWNINSVLKKFTLSVSGQYTRQKAKNRPRLSDSPGNSNFSIFMFPNTLPLSAIQGKDSKGALDDGNELGYQANVYQTNPYWGAYNFYRLDQTDRFLGNVSLKYNILDWLYVQGRAGTDFLSRDDASYTGYGTAFKPKGDYYESFTTLREDNLDLFVGATKTFSDFNVDVLLGGNRMRRSSESKGGGGDNLVVPFVHSVRNVAAPSFSYGFSELGINSVFAQANVGYKNFLFLNGTVRQDQFSTLSSNNNTLVYPSVGASFIATDAFKLPEAINFAKVRASWAQVGGGAPNPYALNLTYGLVGQGHLGANLGQVNNGSIPNQNLQPYLSSEFEIGADFRFLKNRFGLDVAYYSRRTTNDILAAGISSTSGYGSTLINIGELTNKGLELMVNATVIQQKDFKWELSFNYAINRSNVVNLGTNAAGKPVTTLNLEESRVRRERIAHVVGQPLGMITGYKHRTDDKGNLMYNADGYPVSTAGYEVLAEGRHPVSGGLSSILSWKQFKLDVLVDFRQGGSVVSGTNYYGYYYGLHQGTLPGRDGSLKVTGVTTAGAPNTWTIPAANIDNYYQNYANVTQNMVYDASFGRLRQMSLGYTMPATMLKKTPFESASLSIVGRNLFMLWSNVPNIDPESAYTVSGSSQGLEFFAMPQTRSVGVNLSVNF
jgi:TonB-linked SusC/RagA family outer membrane protein